MEDTFYLLLLVTTILSIPAAVYGCLFAILAIQAKRGGHTAKQWFQMCKDEF